MDKEQGCIVRKVAGSSCMKGVSEVRKWKCGRDTIRARMKSFSGGVWKDGYSISTKIY